MLMMFAFAFGKRGEEMKKIGWKFTSALVVVLLSGVAVKAQSALGQYAKLNGLRQLEIGKALMQMPEKGDRPEDFVPPHWSIFSRAEGDLNADGIKDYAFILTLNQQDTKYIEQLRKLDENDLWLDETFIIVVLDSRGDRRHHIGAINYQLFGDSGATISGDERNEFKVEIKKNVLEIALDYGGMHRSSATFRFRMNPPTGGTLTLIGFDFGNSCVTLSADCNKWQMSENYLTNTRVETSYKVLRDKLVGSDRKTQIPAVSVDFMDARLNNGNKKENVRPF
jgi:hypothetical protein